MDDKLSNTLMQHNHQLLDDLEAKDAIIQSQAAEIERNKHEIDDLASMVDELEAKLSSAQAQLTTAVEAEREVLEALEPFAKLGNIIERYLLAYSAAEIHSFGHNFIKAGIVFRAHSTVERETKPGNSLPMSSENLDKS